MRKVPPTLDALIEIIVDLAPGQTLPPHDVLARDLGVSRAVLREVIAVLTYLRVLDVKPKRGTCATDPEQWVTVNRDVLEWRTRAVKRTQEGL